MKASRVRLETLNRGHSDASLRWFNDRGLARLLGRARAISRDEHSAWFDRLERQAVPYFAIVRLADQTHIGNVWLARVVPYDSAEIRIVLGEPGGMNAGLGTEAIEAICAYAFDVLKLRRLEAFVFQFNRRARRAFEKAGFVVASRSTPEADSPGKVGLVRTCPDTLTTGAEQMMSSQVAHSKCDVCGSDNWEVIVRETEWSVCSGHEVLANSRPLVKALCRTCGFVETTQSPLDSALDEYYASQYSAKLQDHDYDYRSYTHNAWFRDVLNEFVLSHRFGDRGRLLDIGCGKGFFLERFAAEYPQWLVEGVDPSHRSIEIARASTPRALLHTRNFLGSDYVPHSYDCVAIHTVLNRVKPRAFVQQAVDLLRIDGILSIEIALLEQCPMQLFFADHHFMFFVEHVLALAEQFGLEVIKQDSRGNLARFLFRKTGRRRTAATDALQTSAGDIVRRAREIAASWQDLRSTVEGYRNSGARVAFYGAGTTLAILLAQAQFPASRIFGIFEDNSHKVGGTIAGITIEATSPRMRGADAIVLCAGPEGTPSMLKRLDGFPAVHHLGKGVAVAA